MTRARLPVLLALVLPVAAGAFDTDSLPLSEDERLQRFAQQHLYSSERCEPGTHEVPEAGPGGLRVEQSGARLALTGKDRGGRPFRVRMALEQGPCALYRADVDKDGTQDLLVLSSRGSGAKGPRAWLTVVLFDAAGRPVPWAAEGPFVGDEHGVEDVLDLDGDGQAEVVRQEAGERYWLASLYEARGARMQRVQGAHGERSWPLATRKVAPGRKPDPRVVTPPKGQQPFEADLGQGEAWGEARTRLTGLEFSSVKAKGVGAPRMTLADGRTCEPLAGAGTFTVVLDAPEGREVAQFSDPEAVKKLLEAVREKGLAVTLGGQRTRGKCSPEWVHAAVEPAP
jgi:hypothetical protein